MGTLRASSSIAPHLSRSLWRTACNAFQLGGNFPTSLAPRKSTTAWFHSSMETAERAAHVGICPLSSPSSVPLLSRECPAGLSTGFSGGRRAPASGPLSLITTRMYHPVGDLFISAKLQWACARISVDKT